jgi:GNAT superfamily N-acetyltransferase
MLNIIEINKNNIDYLKNFILNEIPPTFRYFKTRNIDIVKNHIITIILLDDDISVGYAHIDCDFIGAYTILDAPKYWFGICLLEKYHGKGLGKYIMKYIFNNEKINNLNEVFLTVDKINEKAIKLYKQFDFNIIEEKENFYLMKKIIN